MARTVLIVDDDLAQIQAARVFLQKHGFDTVVAQDAYTATTHAAKSSPCLVLLDYEMPAGTGAAVFKRLRGLSQTMSTPVIFISGHDPKKIAGEIGAAASTRILSKPVDWKLVIAAIGELLPGAIPDQPAS